MSEESRARTTMVDDQQHAEKLNKSMPNRAFLGELYKHRGEVYRYAMGLDRSDEISAFVFDLLVRLAQHNHTFIDRSLIQRLSDKLEGAKEPISEANLSLMEGMVLTLEQALTLGAPPPSTHDMLNAFFARGYHLYIKSKNPEERQDLASRVIKQLPNIERLGAFKLSDFIDQACSREESQRFWQLYVERVAAEVDRRTRQSERSPHTWILSALLETHEMGPNALLGKRWEVLRRHIERITQSQQDDRRWRYLRLIIESCQDHRALYFILNSPSVIEDKVIPFIFLTRGNRKLQSCALFLLYTTKTKRSQINQLLEYFEDRSIAEVGERSVELYAQTQLFEHPTPAIKVLRDGLVSIITHKLTEEPLDHLLNAVTNDAHAFRQSLLLTEVIPHDRVRNTPTQVQLLERVLQSFFHTFTPSGVRHPLNDLIFQRGVTKAIVELMRDQDTGHIAHLKRFGLTLDTAAKRWRPGDSEEEESKRHLLLSYFIGLYVHVLRRAARQLHQKYETRSRALELYEVIITLYIGQPAASVDSGAYEDLLPILRSLFPEFVSTEYLEAPAQSRIDQATQMIAQVEDERVLEEGLLGLLDEWRDRNRGRDLVVEQESDSAASSQNAAEEKLEIETRGFVPIVTTTPVRAAVRIHRSGHTPRRGAWRSYLPLDLFKYYLERLLKLLGYTPQGELSLIGEQVLLSESYRRANQSKASEYLARFHISQLSGVSVDQPLRTFYLVFGVIALVFCCFVGGQLLFAGVRGAETELGFIGLGFIGLGLAIDMAASALRARHEREVTLNLHRHHDAGTITLGINRDEPQGQALINAFMVESVRQREEQFVQRLAQAAEQQAEFEEQQRERQRLEELEAKSNSNSAGDQPESLKQESDQVPSEGDLSDSRELTEAGQPEPDLSADAQDESLRESQEPESSGSEGETSRPPQSLDISFDDDSGFEDDLADEPENREEAGEIKAEAEIYQGMGGDNVEYDLDDGNQGSSDQISDSSLLPDENDLAASFDFITSTGETERS